MTPTSLRDGHGAPTRMGSIVRLCSFLIVLVAAACFVPVAAFGPVGAAMLCGHRCEGLTRLMAVLWIVNPALLAIAIVLGLWCVRTPRWWPFAGACTMLAVPLASFLPAM